MEEHDNHRANDHESDGHHAPFRDIAHWIEVLENPMREEGQRTAEIIAHLGLQPDDVVVDIGAGTGHFAIRIAQAYPDVKVLAVDTEPEMIAYLKARSIERNLANLEPVLIDPSRPKLPVKANLALIVHTLHHIDNRIDYLMALKESMASGARIAVIEFAQDAEEGPPEELRMADADVVDVFSQVGYTPEQKLYFLPNQYFLIFRQEL